MLAANPASTWGIVIRKSIPVLDEFKIVGGEMRSTGEIQRHRNLVFCDDIARMEYRGTRRGNSSYGIEADGDLKRSGKWIGRSARAPMYVMVKVLLPAVEPLKPLMV